MAAIIVTEKEQKLHARIEGLKAFLQSERLQGRIDHFLTVGTEIRVWLTSEVGQVADIVLDVKVEAVYVLSGPCRVRVGNGAWKLPKYGFKKPVQSARPIMKSFCDSLSMLV